MFKHYYVNKNAQSTGEHEVHAEGCPYMPLYPNRLYLGYFAKPQEAIKEAKKYYDNVDGCYHCCLPVHTK